MQKDIINDPDYLKKQYNNSSNLNTRQILHEKYSKRGKVWHLWVFDQLELRPGDSVLELGCGQGNLWYENSRRLPSLDLFLGDTSDGMLRKAIQNLQDAGVESQFINLDAGFIPFPSERFDLVIANHMLYHVRDLQETLKEIRRVLKPGGRLYAATNGEKHMYELWQLLRAFCPEISYTLVGDFTLQNCIEKLSETFPGAEVILYDDVLEIPEAGPLLDYILSTRFGDRVRPMMDQISTIVREKINREGYFYIQKQTGVVKALKS